MPKRESKIRQSSKTTICAYALPWASIERFYRNCKAQVKGKKGYPKFAPFKTRGSVEYKTSGWKLSECRRYLKFTDGFKAGNFKLWGSRDLHFYQLEQIKRVRVIRRCDGYYVQFLLDVDRRVDKELTGVQRGLDVGLSHFYTDNLGNKVENPRFLRKDERKLKRLQRRFSRTQKKSNNRAKARNKLGRAHLKVSRRRNDWVCKLAQRVIKSSDLLAIENLQVLNMVKNHKLAKSINDVSWRKFREWLEYFGVVYGVPVIAVNPSAEPIGSKSLRDAGALAPPSVNCSNCGEAVAKTLSTRTHSCPACLYIADRDENAARNILKSSLKQLSTTVGRTESNNASGENDLCLVQETAKSKSAR